MTTAPPRTTRRRWLLLAGGGVTVLALVAAGVLLAWPPASAGNDDPAPDVSTAVVERGDLVEHVRVSGTLGHVEVRDIPATLGGTITGLPPVGSTVGRGQELYRVDNAPVVLMYGTLPAWRPFGVGMDDGPDVQQLEENLAALGFFDRTPDAEFTWATANAVERWQESLGLPETGEIELGRIVFSGDVRVASHVAKVGDPAAGTVITVSSTTKRVTVYADLDLSGIVTVDSVVEVELPDGSRATGRIVSVGAPVERDNANGGKDLTLPVAIELDDPALADGLDNVSVSVILTQPRAQDALLVPVLALLAQPGGGFAVEVVDGEDTELREIELGVFADGMVEVTGGDLAEGDTVVVAE